METITSCFKVILTGDRESSRNAAREVRKLLYSSRGGKDKFEDIKNLINNAPSKYGDISEGWRQENFVMAVSVIYYLHDRENQPNFLFPWLYHLIQHPNGYIRQAAVRMFENELGPLTVHIRCPKAKSNYFRELLSEKSNRILFEIYVNLMSLKEYLWKPVYKKYKYVSSLPDGPYKSVQMVLSRLVENCGEEYMTELKR